MAFYTIPRFSFWWAVEKVPCDIQIGKMWPCCPAGDLSVISEQTSERLYETSTLNIHLKCGIHRQNVQHLWKVFMVAVLSGRIMSVFRGCGIVQGSKTLITWLVETLDVYTRDEKFCWFLRADFLIRLLSYTWYFLPLFCLFIVSSL